MVLMVVIVMAVFGSGIGGAVTDGTRLISTFLVHRHGDRTPIEKNLNLLGPNRAAVEKASAPYGYGEITDVGKRRSYKLGQFIRYRYDELLSSQYNQSEIFIRSTDYARTKMTVLTAMAAVYPSYPGSWSDQINWVPTPYTTVPKKYDFNTFFLNCPNLMDAYSSISVKPLKPCCQFKQLSKVFGYDICEMSNLTFFLYNVIDSQISLGVPVSDDVAAILPELERAAGLSIDTVYGNDDNIALAAGVLLNEFFVQASNLIEGVATPRVRVYSAHDLNVFTLMAVSQIWPRQGVPPFDSAFALELRQVEATGQYVVLPVYLRSPGEDVRYIPVLGCDDLLCDFYQYKKIVSKYTLDEDTWRKQCGFTA